MIIFIMTDDEKTEILADGKCNKIAAQVAKETGYSIGEVLKHVLIKALETAKFPEGSIQQLDEKTDNTIHTDKEDTSNKK